MDFLNEKYHDFETNGCDILAIGEVKVMLIKENKVFTFVSNKKEQFLRAKFYKTEEDEGFFLLISNKGNHLQSKVKKYCIKSDE